MHVNMHSRAVNYLLNGEIFYSLREAQIIIERWRIHYNTKRPHSALGYLTTVEGLKMAAQTLEMDVARLSCCMG